MSKNKDFHPAFYKRLITASAATFSLIIPGISFCEEGIAPVSKQSTENLVAGVFQNYSLEQAGLTALILVVLAYFFYILFKWSQRNEQASYLGHVFLDSVIEFEFNRRKARIEQNRTEGEYNNRAYHFIQDELSKSDTNIKEPKFPLELHQYIQIREGLIPRQRDGGYSLRPGSNAGLGGLGSRSSPGYGGTLNDSILDDPNIVFDINRMTPEHKAIYEEFNIGRDKFKEFQIDLNERLHSQEKKYYDHDLKLARSEAIKQAECAIDVDISIFRGRGPAFVLEFTAIVVIIFSAVILGILGVLVSDQIATLLAAVAGYVLGRSTNHSGDSSRSNQKTNQQEHPNDPVTSNPTKTPSAIPNNSNSSH